MKRKLIKTICILAISSLCIAGNAFAVKNDRVTSQKIKEADNTSSQNTNSGSGVKTGHIANGAVTDAKINDVSMAKVTGLDSALNEKSDAGHGHFFGNIAVVAISGGDYHNPATAMNDLASWCGVPSASNQCVVKVMPGTYTLFETMTMSPYVSLVGSGSASTTIGFEDVEAASVGDSAGVSIENLTISAINFGGNGRWAISLTETSVQDGFTLKNTLIKSDKLGVEIRNNDVSVNIENSDIFATDALVSVYGTTSTTTLQVNISNSSLTGTGPTPTTGEAGMFGWNMDRLTISDVKIAHLYENFQVQANQIMVNNLTGVQIINPQSSKVIIRDSILGDINGGTGPVTLYSRTTGFIKVINTMLVGGTTASGNVALANCYDQDLNPVVLP